MNEWLFSYYRGTCSSCVCTGDRSGCQSFGCFSPVNNSTGPERLCYHTETTSDICFPLWSRLKFSFIQTCWVPEFVMGYSISAPPWDQWARAYVAHATGGCLRGGVLCELEATCVGTQETFLGASRPAAKQTALQLLTAQCSHSPQ